MTKSLSLNPSNCNNIVHRFDSLRQSKRAWVVYYLFVQLKYPTSIHQPKVDSETCSLPGALRAETSLGLFMLPRMTEVSGESGVWEGVLASPYNFPTEKPKPPPASERRYWFPFKWELESECNLTRTHRQTGVWEKSCSEGAHRNRSSYIGAGATELYIVEE